MMLLALALERSKASGIPGSDFHMLCHCLLLIVWLFYSISCFLFIMREELRELVSGLKVYFLEDLRINV